MRILNGLRAKNLGGIALIRGFFDPGYGGSDDILSATYAMISCMVEIFYCEA
jgi:hypothetical protein